MDANTIVDIILYEEAAQKAGADVVLALGLIALLLMLLFMGAANKIAPEGKEVETIVDAAGTGMSIILLILSLPLWLFGSFAMMWVFVNLP